MLTSLFIFIYIYVLTCIYVHTYIYMYRSQIKQKTFKTKTGERFYAHPKLPQKKMTEIML